MKMRSERLQARRTKEAAANRSISPPTDNSPPNVAVGTKATVKSSRQYKHNHTQQTSNGHGSSGANSKASSRSSHSGWESSSQSKSPDSEQSQEAISVPSSSHSPQQSSKPSMMLPASSSKKLEDSIVSSPSVDPVGHLVPTSASVSGTTTAPVIAAEFGAEKFTTTRGTSSKSHVYLRARSTLQKLREVELDEAAEHDLTTAGNTAEGKGPSKKSGKQVAGTGREKSR